MDQLMQGLGVHGMNGFPDMGPKPLVEFKAGKMNYDGKMVTPDRRKGIIRVVEDAGGMKQFQWCDDQTKNPIESFYVFPGDAKFEKVKKNKDRVYLLEMIHIKNRYFYWMQDEETEKDKENARKVHEVLNNIKTTETKTKETPGGQFPPTATGPMMTS